MTSMPPSHPRSRVNVRLRLLIVGALCVGLFAIGRSLVGGNAEAREPGKTPARAGVTPLSFSGMCDASGAVFLSERELAVADDESNVIRIYDPHRGGAPLRAVDLADHIALPHEHRREREADLEAVTRVGEVAFWIGSHGRSKKGKLKPERQVLFATDVRTFATVGGVYRTLLDDLERDERYAALGIAQDSPYGPLHPRGVNVEGLSTRTEGGLWIAFRNPRPHGRALLAPLENPREVVEGSAPRFGAPVLVDLGGRGIRDVAPYAGGYLIAAGIDADSPDPKLYKWNGKETPTPLSYDLHGLNVEALVVAPSGKALLLSDDGRTSRGAVECKRAPVSARSFRGLWLAPIP